MGIKEHIRATNIKGKWRHRCLARKNCLEYEDGRTRAVSTLDELYLARQKIRDGLSSWSFNKYRKEIMEEFQKTRGDYPNLVDSIDKLWPRRIRTRSHALLIRNAWKMRGLLGVGEEGGCSVKNFSRE